MPPLLYLLILIGAVGCQRSFEHTRPWNEPPAWSPATARINGNHADKPLPEFAEDRLSAQQKVELEAARKIPMTVAMPPKFETAPLNRQIYSNWFFRGYTFTEATGWMHHHHSLYVNVTPARRPIIEGWLDGQQQARIQRIQSVVDSMHSNRPRGTKAASEFTILSLNAKANNPAAGPDERCLSIFALFRDFIKPGCTPQEIHGVLTDTRWLELTNILGIYVLAGWIPVDFKGGRETPFVVSVLPAIKPSTGRPPNLGYHIYFTLTGGASRPAKSAYGILTGEHAWDTNTQLVEFALCYPDGTIECVTKSGTRRFKQFGQKNQPIKATARMPR